MYNKSKWLTRSNTHLFLPLTPEHLPYHVSVELYKILRQHTTTIQSFHAPVGKGNEILKRNEIEKKTYISTSMLWMYSAFWWKSSLKALSQSCFINTIYFMVLTTPDYSRGICTILVTEAYLDNSHHAQCLAHWMSYHGYITPGLSDL